MVDTNVLRNVNLNRLPVLWELLRCRSVSLAAANLCLTQSTVSAALKSLRELFDDELLVPAGRELVLTERAQEIVPLLEATLSILGDLVRAPEFDPGEDDGIFRIGTADYVSFLLLPALAQTLQASAPRLTVQFVAAEARGLQDLKLGLIDVVIGPEQVLDWIGIRGHEGSFHFERCFVDPLVGIRRKPEAPSATAAPKMSLDDYLARPHASVYLHRELPASIEHDVLILKQLRQRNRFLVPEFTLLPMIVAQSDLISLVPRSMATYYAGLYHIALFEPPIEFPPLALNLLWLRGRERDKRFCWFLDAVRASFAALRGDAGAALPERVS